MYPNYLYRPHQAPLARPWSKPRRGLLLSLWLPSGAKWALFGMPESYIWRQVGW